MFPQTKITANFFFRRNLLQSEYSLTLKIRYTKIQSLEIVSVLLQFVSFVQKQRGLQRMRYWFT